MTLSVGTILPDFEARSNKGAFRFSDWLGGRWALVLAFRSMSPTCSTEFVELDRLHPEFERCGARILCVSVDPDEMVTAWLDDVREMFGASPSFTLINDLNGPIPETLGLLDPNTPQRSLVRGAYLVSPEQRIVMSIAYPVTNGRSFVEILRTLKAIQLTAEARVATSSTWTDGQPVMLPPSLSQEQANAMYPAGVQVLRPYLRLVAQPGTDLAAQPVAHAALRPHPESN